LVQASAPERISGASPWRPNWLIDGVLLRPAGEVLDFLDDSVQRFVRAAEGLHVGHAEALAEQRLERAQALQPLARLA
jgi:hypothetical protein